MIRDMFTLDSTPCGAPVYCTDISEWVGNGRPHPITGNPQELGTFKMQRIPANDPGSVSDNDYFVAVLADGTFLRLFND